MAKTPLFEVMLSSTFKDLMELREAALHVLLHTRCFPIAMEHDSSLSTENLIAASLNKVDAAHGYLCVMGWVYGQRPKSRKRNPKDLSLTELEFDRALDRGIPISVIELTDRYPVGEGGNEKDPISKSKLEDFRKKVRAARVSASVSDRDEYSNQLPLAIGELREKMREMYPEGVRTTEEPEWESFSTAKGDGTGYNDKFYSLLIETLGNSKQLALVAGEGFEIHDEDSRRRADRYLRVLANRACRHLVYRIEFTESGKGREWIESVAALAPFFDGTRGLRILRPNPSIHLIRNMAIVDPGSESNSEALLIMLPRQLSDPLAGIISRAQAAAVTRTRSTVRAAWSSIGHMLSDANLFAIIETPEQLLQHYGLSNECLSGSNEEPSEFYFAYGSNMGLQQMSARAPSATPVEAATLRDHKLVFGEPPVPISGGVASIKRSPGDQIEGCLYRINKFDLETRLGFFEGVREDIYKLSRVSVNTSTGSVDAATFVFCKPTRPPHKTYNDMIDGARRSGCSISYIDTLRAVSWRE
jgi:hypothetical protein